MLNLFHIFSRPKTDPIIKEINTNRTKTELDKFTDFKFTDSVQFAKFGRFPTSVLNPNLKKTHVTSSPKIEIKNVKKNVRTKKLTGVELDSKICKLYIEKVPVREILKKYQINYAQLYKIINAHQLPKRSENYNFSKSKYQTVDWKMMCKDMKKILNIRKVPIHKLAKDMKVSTKYLSNVLNGEEEDFKVKNLIDFCNKTNTQLGFLVNEKLIK